MTNPSDSTINPGDEAQPGTPGSGEDVCPICQGTGVKPDDDDGEGTPCPNCGGTGIITEGIGGG
ncbi:hypothetical protein GTP45_19155 [Pseudoduganella sp. FT55W]|uniref:Molecular chaperone DnaJ n=1 Tax=Duganella rivi TaxID=2666083 RepID=A0A7X4GSN9_9BURK|nr:hypothetical protein [Duganella rivi]MYM68938.1 hypothetical protein [Duganella rivi]